MVAKQARAFSPSRSLIAWIVLTIPPLQFPPLPPRCITLGIYSSICRHLAKYRLGGWSFLETTGPTSAVEWIWPGTISETERARGRGTEWWRQGDYSSYIYRAMRQWGPRSSRHLLIGREERRRKRARPTYRFDSRERIYASDAPNSALRFAYVRHHLHVLCASAFSRLTMTDWKNGSIRDLRSNCNRIKPLLQNGVKLHYERYIFITILSCRNLILQDSD